MKTKTKARSRWLSLIPVMFALAGVLLLLYPVIATVINNHNQTGQAQVYAEQISTQVSAEERERAIVDAHAWNAQHQGMPVLDPWLARITDDNPNYKTYLAQLNTTDAMGRVIIPKINSDLPIYHGTTDDVLTKGIGHLYGSSLPVGGEGTHAVITGHTGLPGATLWDNLTELTYGDAFYMDVSGQKMKYTISDIRVVLPEETDSLRPELGKDQVTLITCTPYGINSHRLLLTGQRAPLEAEEEVFAQTYSPWQWWMTFALALVALVFAVAVALWWRSRARKGAVHV